MTAHQPATIRVLARPKSTPIRRPGSTSPKATASVSSAAARLPRLDHTQRVAMIMSSNRWMPIGAGVGLRLPHVAEVVATRPSVPWLEIHPENFLANPHATELLFQVCRDYPISVHTVGISVGSVAGIDHVHLRRVRTLVDIVDPVLVSGHLAWSTHDGEYLNDLLPLSYDEETLRLVAAHIEQVQDSLGRPYLLENPSSYLGFDTSTMSELDFLCEFVRRTGCRLLCDISNVYLSAHNMGYDPWRYIDGLPVAAIGELHLGGFTPEEDEAEPGAEILIDTHAAGIAPLLIGGRDPGQRLAIHQRHYRSSLVAAIRTKFPATAWLLGMPFLDEAAKQFVRQQPPAAPCIAEYGEEFPRFLSTYLGGARVPFLCSFAELEWHLGQVAIAVDRPALALDAFSALEINTLMDASLMLQAGFRYLHASWPVDDLMKLYLTDTAHSEYRLAPTDVWLEVRGSRGEFQINRLNAAEFVFRKAVLDRQSIGNAAQRALDTNAEFDAGQAFTTLVNGGYVIAITTT